MQTSEEKNALLTEHWYAKLGRGMSVRRLLYAHSTWPVGRQRWRDYGPRNYVVDGLADHYGTAPAGGVDESGRRFISNGMYVRHDVHWSQEFEVIHRTGSFQAILGVELCLHDREDAWFPLMDSIL